MCVCVCVRSTIVFQPVCACVCVAVRLCEWDAGSVSGVGVSGPGGDWKADFISLKEETKEDASGKKREKKCHPSSARPPPDTLGICMLN